MKSLLSLALAAITLAFFFAGSMALAQEGRFGPASAPFAMDVPQGWEAQKSPSGVRVFHKDGSFVEVSIAGNSGETAEEAAMRLAGALSQPEAPEKAQGGLVRVRGFKDGKPALLEVSVRLGVRTAFILSMGEGCGPIRGSVCWLREYGPKEARFVMHVPFGWVEQRRKEGFQLSSPDGLNSLAIMDFPNPKRKSAEEFARTLARQLKGENFMRDFGSDSWSFDMKADATHTSHAIVQAIGRRFELAILGGDRRLLETLLASRTWVKNEAQNEGLLRLIPDRGAGGMAAPSVPSKPQN